MRPPRARSALLVLLAAAAVALVTYGVLEPAGSTTSRRAAPALPRTTLFGPPVTLAALRGHPAVVIFWASWCPGCHREAPAVERFARSAAGRGRVITVDYSDGGDWHGFVRRYAWSVPVFADRDGTLGAAYGINGLPATVILDARGRIAATSVLPQTVSSLTRALETGA